MILTFAGEKVKTIKDPLDDIIKSAKFINFDYLQIFEDKFIILASKASCGVWRLDFNDINSRRKMGEMLKLKENYSNLFLS